MQQSERLTPHMWLVGSTKCGWESFSLVSALESIVRESSQLMVIDGKKSFLSSGKGYVSNFDQNRRIFSVFVLFELFRSPHTHYVSLLVCLCLSEKVIVRALG